MLFFFVFFSFSTSIMYMGVSKNRGKTPKSSHLFIGFSIIFTIHIGWFGGTIIFGNTHINIYSILIYSYSLFCWFSFTRQLVLFILNIHISTMVLLLYKHTSQRQWHWTWNQKFNWRSHAFTFLNVETPELHQLCFEGTKMHLQAVKHQVEGQGWVTFTWWNVTHPYEFWFGESVRLMNPYEIFQFGLVKLMNPYEIFHFGWWNLWILMKSSILVGETYESLWNLSVWFGETYESLWNLPFWLVKLMNPYEIFHFGWWNLWILMKSSKSVFMSWGFSSAWFFLWLILEGHGRNKTLGFLFGKHYPALEHAPNCSIVP